MARATKQVARKDYPEQGIKKGDEYYKWSFRFGGSFKSLKPPRNSQLTQSAYLGGQFDIQDSLSGLTNECVINGRIEEIADEIRELGESQLESLENMPEGLQQGSTGELLQERSDACEAAADELSEIEVPDPVDEPDGCEFDEEQPEEKDFANDNNFQEALEAWEEAKAEHESEQVDLAAAFSDYEDELEAAVETAQNICWD